MRVWWRTSSRRRLRLVARFLRGGLCGLLLRGRLRAADVFFAGLREAVFFGRAGAIGSLPLEYQMYQMRVRAEQVSSFQRRVSMIGCLIVPSSNFLNCEVEECRAVDLSLVVSFCHSVLLLLHRLLCLSLLRAETKRRTFVLVHGAWHGGWCWRRVADRLTAKGHYVVAPALSGVGERSHLKPEDIDLTTQIDDVVGEIKWKDLDDIVLVGHSYGGMVITGVAEQMHERIGRLCISTRLCRVMGRRSRTFRAGPRGRSR